METPDGLKTLYKPETKETGRDKKSLTETFQITNYLSMPMGIKLRVNMCGEYSGRKTLLNWRMSLPLLQLIPISGITHPQNKRSTPR